MSRPARRILIIRLSAIGDVVMASGLIPALRARYPGAHLAWLAEPAGASLLAGHPRLDEVITLPRPDWKRLRGERRLFRLARDMTAFRRALRARDFDLALDAQGLLKSAVWAWASGAGERIGLGSREGSARLMTDVLPVAADDPAMGSEYRALAAHLGAPAEAFRMDLSPPPERVDEARTALAEAGVTGAWAAVCPFTTRPQKHWFDARWAELLPVLQRETGLVPVLLGGPADTDHAGRLVRASGGAAVSLAGRLSLGASVAAIQRASALVGVDTGLTHVGTAAGIPTVALFGSTRPYLETPSGTTRVLYEPLWCSPCRRSPICGGVHSCMRLHRSERVLAELRGLLGHAA